MVSQFGLAKVLAVGCGLGAVTIACRGSIITELLRRLTASWSKPKPAAAEFDTILADEVPSVAQPQVKAASTTGRSPSESAEIELPTAVSTSTFSSGVAEVLIDDECSKARPSVAARAAAVVSDGKKPAELAEDSGRPPADDGILKTVHLRARNKQHKVTLRSPDLDPIAFEAKQAKAEQAAAELLRQEEEEQAAKAKAAEKQRAQKKKKRNKGKKEPKQAPLPSPGASECLSDESPAPEDVVSSSHCASGPDDTASTGDDVDSAADRQKLQYDCDALLDLAAHCTDAEQQPIMLARVAKMLQRCGDAGISVKYGRKLLQRLQAVAPAREALQSALSSPRITYEELAAALTAAKACRSLLEGHLIQLAEEVLTELMREQAALTEQQQAQQQPVQEQLLQQHKKQQQQQQRQRDQHLKSTQPQQRQRRQAGQQLQMHGHAGLAVPVTESVMYQGISAEARRGAAGPRAAGHKDEQPSAASTSSGMSAASAAAAAGQRHAGVQVVLCRSSSAAPGSAGQVLPLGCRGLTNLGNTCYQNSIVQCLNCLPDLEQPLRHAAQQMQSAVGSGTLIQWKSNALVGPALGALLTDMRTGQSEQQDSLSPCKFKQAVTGVKVQWGDGRQQDSQEFLESLLDQLQNESNRVHNTPEYKELLGYGPEAQQAAEAEAYARSWHDSFIDDLFGGLLQSTLTCSHCNHERHCFEPFLNLCVPIPKGQQVSVQDCLAAFAAEETLTGGNQVMCSACRNTCDATKQLRICAYPKLLAISLKRFSCSKGGDPGYDGFSQLSKNQTAVDIYGEQLLDLAPCCSSTGLKAAAVKGRKKPRYELLAMSEHSGCLGGGHYTATGRSTADGRWYCFNDSSVTAGSCPSGSSSNAYILFYRLLDD